jgi:hypothetical protein
MIYKKRGGIFVEANLKNFEEKARKELLDSFSYKELAELKLLIRKMQNNVSNVYEWNYNHDYNMYRYTPIIGDEGPARLLTKEETKEFITTYIDYYKNLMSQCDSIEEFGSMLPEEPDNCDLEEKTYTGSFNCKIDIATTVDEETALRANTLIFEGKSSDEIDDFVKKNNKSKYILFEESFDLLFKTGQYYDCIEEKLLFSTLPELKTYKTFICINLNDLEEILNDLGFGFAMLSKNGEDFVYVYNIDEMCNSIISDTWLFLFDKTLERDPKDEVYTVFPKQKKKVKKRNG